MAPEVSERRSILLAGAGLFGALLVLVVVAIVFSGGAGDPDPVTTSTVACAAGDEVCLAAQRPGERPGIIPHPGDGRTPADPGEPGGWEQLALLGVILVAVAAITTVVVRSARRSRRGAGADPDDGTPVGTPS